MMSISQARYDEVFGSSWHVGGAEIAKSLVYITNAGTPASAIVPEFIGQECFDTVGEDFYRATGLANTDWKQVTA